MARTEQIVYFENTARFAENTRVLDRSTSALACGSTQKLCDRFRNCDGLLWTSFKNSSHMRGEELFEKNTSQPVTRRKLVTERKNTPVVTDATQQYARRISRPAKKECPKRELQCCRNSVFLKRVAFYI